MTLTSKTILIFSPNLGKFIGNSFSGGAEKQLLLLSKELSKKNYQIIALTEFCKITDSLPFKVIFYKKFSKILSKLSILSLIFKITLSVLKTKPHFIFLRCPSNISIVFTLLSYFFKFKIIFFSANDKDFISDQRLNRCNEFIFKWLINKSHKILVQNTMQKESLKQHYQ